MKMEVSETISEKIETAETAVEGIGVPVPVGAVGHHAEDAEHYENCTCVEALRRVEVFADLPFEQLEWFIENSDERVLEPGEILFLKGDAAEWMVIYLEGEVHASRNENALDGYVYIARAGDAATEVSGRLPFSRMKETQATGRAVVKTRVLLFPVRLFPELIVRMPILAERLVWIMTDRVREMTQADERRDKLMALGKLSAGLAHELNNPAAAARRTSDELMQTLENLRVADLNLCRHNLTHEQREELSDYECAAISETDWHSSTANALAMSDREDELTEWLEKRGIENAWKLSSTLADSGISTEKLEKIAADFAPEALKDVLTRIVVQIMVSRQASEIKTSVTRISDLVGAIKEYSYMDQAAVQAIDLHKGLDNTLLILKHKLKSKSINVVREYDENLPRITAHGSLLNQVWTNLIDNAVDAMTTGGRLKIMTRLEPDNVLIEIRDNGAGIPPAIQSRIFEPFFTTKGVSEGTGLGLDAVARIVRKHRGNIRFQTKPGDTCFQVRLPLEKNQGASI